MQMNIRKVSQMIEGQAAQQRPVAKRVKIEGMAEELRIGMSQQTPMTHHHLIHHVHVVPRVSEEEKEMRVNGRA